MRPSAEDSPERNQPVATPPTHPPAAAADSPPEEPEDYDGEEWAPPPHTRRRGAYIISLIALTGLVVLVMLAIIYHRWLTVEEPTTAILVEGDESVDGTIIEVVGGPKPISVRLGKENNYMTPVLLAPGFYTVTGRLGDLVIVRQELALKPMVGRRILLGRKLLENTPGAPPAEAPSGPE
jgi:hypothetical protein